jgi:hypothetical protein
MSEIKCGSCGNYHMSVAAVRGCYARKYGQAETTPQASAADTLQRARSARQAQTAHSYSPAEREAAQTQRAIVTDKQLAFINDLVASRDGAGKATVSAVRSYGLTSVTALPRTAASELISKLKVMPKIDNPPQSSFRKDGGARKASEWDEVRDLQSQLPDIPHARYAIRVLDFEGSGKAEWKFYKIDKPKEGTWAGRTFVKAIAGDEEWPVRKPASLKSILGAILNDPAQAAANYGLKIGKCGICGRTLTVPESIERGIGPVCLSRIGGGL